MAKFLFEDDTRDLECKVVAFGQTDSVMQPEDSFSALFDALVAVTLRIHQIEQDLESTRKSPPYPGQYIPTADEKITHG